MGEEVIVRQNDKFETEILALDPHDPDGTEFRSVEHMHQLTPYGMLLASLGSCTAIVMHTYAQYHDVDLHEVELHLQYDRIFAEDCEDCEHIHEYKEQIEEGITVLGDLTPEERKRLFAVSKHCPIHKILAHGIEVQSHLVEDL
jgi:putative redox protein